METTKAISRPMASPTPLAPRDPSGAAPWLEAAQPASPITARRLPRRVVPVGRRNRAVEVLHWGVVLLTLITASSILFGARAAEGSQPRELLPIMIVAPAR
jgi:hypothetical protein